MSVKENNSSEIISMRESKKINKFNPFIKFDCESFFKEKKLAVKTIMSTKPLKLEVLIVKDQTKYEGYTSNKGKCFLISLNDGNEKKIQENLTNISEDTYFEFDPDDVVKTSVAYGQLTIVARKFTVKTKQGKMELYE